MSFKLFWSFCHDSYKIYNDMNTSFDCKGCNHKLEPYVNML